jgi:NADP-dependent 3-hydroxy acid dehydrogenase YdfG
VKTAVVTGASSGIGDAAARRLAREGWKLLLVARREDRLAQLAGEIGASYLAVDLVDPQAPERVRARVDEELGGRLDLLVNNAGAGWRARFGDEDGGYENVRKTMEINFDAVLRLTEALLPVLRRSPSPAGASRSTSRRSRTACMWASCTPASSPRRASPRRTSSATRSRG